MEPGESLIGNTFCRMTYPQELDFKSRLADVCICKHLDDRILEGVVGTEVVHPKSAHEVNHCRNQVNDEERKNYPSYGDLSFFPGPADPECYTQ